MKTFFGIPRTAVALVGIVVAIILVVVVGLIIIGSAAIRALMAPGVKVEGVSLLALLVTIIVLLTAVFIMLLVLFWCCCRHTRGGKDGQLPPNVVTALLPFLPLLPQMRNALKDLAIALYAAGQTLRWLNTNITIAGTFVQGVANAAGADSNKIEAKKFPNFVDFEQVNPLQPLVSNLESVARSLNPASAYPLTLGGDALDVGEVGQSLEDASKVLAGMAQRLGATLPSGLPTP